MEVRDHAIHHVEVVAGQNVEARGLAVARQQFVRLRIPSALKAAYAGGANGNNASTRGFCFLYGFHHSFWYGVILRVDVVVFGVFLVHNAEGAQAHFKLDSHPLHAHGLDFLDELRREMQARGGSCGRALAFGEHRLIHFHVARVILDIGRQRRFTHGMKRFVQRRVRGGQARQTLALVVFAFMVHEVDDLGGKCYVAILVAKVHNGACFKPATRLYKHFPISYRIWRCAWCVGGKGTSFRSCAALTTPLCPRPCSFGGDGVVLRSCAALAVLLGCRLPLGSVGRTFLCLLEQKNFRRTARATLCSQQTCR